MSSLSLPAEVIVPPDSPVAEFGNAPPASAPAAATVALASLVHHRWSVNAGETLEVVQRTFQTHRVEYMAVEKEGRVIGMCARGQIGFIMSARFGFAIYSQNPISSVMVERPLRITVGSSVLTLLDEALSRTGDDFQQDVVLVDGHGRLVGLVKVETLAQLQSRMVGEQVRELRRHHEVLRRQNLALFRATHAARQSQGVYTGLFENHALGVALLDANGNILEHNQRLSELLSCDHESVALVSLVPWLKEPDRPRLLTLLDAHVRGAAQAATHEFVIEVAERGERTFRCSTGWIRETGQICACLDDVTEQRALERQALQLEKQNLLDTLVAGVAHELNNKLTPVLGFSELLRTETEGRAGEYVTHITKSVDEAARIIRQLLELSNPTSHISQLLDLRSVIDETLVMLKFHLREAGCAVQTRLPAVPVCVAGDGAQLKQVLMNLAINALHAMEGRDAPVLTFTVRSAGERAEIVVADNGCGIPAENLQRIFDPFFTTKGPKLGTGLGLSICFSIIRQHGGEIRVRSTPGEGAQFTVSLPAQVGAPRRTMTDAGTTWSPAAARFQPGQRVLVIEDEVVVRRLMHEVLSTQFGCRVDLAEDGDEALALLRRNEYALVLTDVKMPHVSGLELHARIRRENPDLARRVVFVSGQPADHDLLTKLDEWQVPLVAKPFTIARLTEACRPFLQLEVALAPA